MFKTNTPLLSIEFQHTAARGRLEVQGLKRSKGVMFQHTAARGRLVCSYYSLPWFMAFQHTAARGRLVPNPHLSQKNTSCFNTQPPEGGWLFLYSPETSYSPCFNTQPPEGGWRFLSISFYPNSVSTHSRPRAAGGSTTSDKPNHSPFQHTAARGRLDRQQGLPPTP